MGQGTGMTSQEIADWVQIATGIALLAGLGLVIWELQQSRELHRTGLFSDAFSLYAQQRVPIMGENPSEVLARACTKPDQLTDSDLEVLTIHYTEVYSRILRIKLFGTFSDLYEPESWRAFLPMLEEVFRTIPGQVWWTTNKQVYDTGIRTAGDQYLQKFGPPNCHLQNAGKSCDKACFSVLR